MPNVVNIDEASLAQLTEEQIQSFKQGFSPDTQFGVAPAEPTKYDPEAPPSLDAQSFSQLTPEQLADFAVKTKWSPYAHAQANPGLEQDNAAIDKLAQTDLLLRKRGFKLSDVDWGSVAKAPVHLVSGLFSYAQKLATGATSPLYEAGNRLAGGEPGIMTKAGTKAMGEAIAGTELAATGTIDLARRGLEKTGRFFHLTKSLDQFTPEDARTLFQKELGIRNQLIEITKGKGVMTEELGGQAVKDAQIDPEEVAKASAGDPLTFMAFGGGFRVINAATGKVLATAATKSAAMQTVAKLNALRGFKTSAEKLASGIPSAENLAAANKAAIEYYSTRGAAGVLPSVGEAVSRAVEAIPSTAEVIGKGAELVGRGIEKVAPLSGVIAAAEGVATGRPWQALALLGGRGGRGFVAPVVEKAGAVLQKAGGELAGKETAGWTRAAEDLLNFPQNVTKGALRGLPVDLGLAALTAETPEETRESPLMMTAFGGLHGAGRSLGGFVQGQTIAPRPWKPSGAWLKNYGHFPEFDAGHTTTMKIASEGVKERLGALRDLAETTDTELYAFQGPTDLARALERAGYSPEDAANMAQANAVALGKVADANGVARKVIFIREPEAAPHEVGHPLENIFTQSQQNLLYDQIEKSYGTQAIIERAFREADALAATPEARQELAADWMQYLLRATGFGKASGADFSDPAIVAELVKRYALKEIAADTIGTVIRHATPEMLDDTTFLGTTARVLAKMMMLVGQDPYQGVEAQGPFATPIKMPVAEAARKLVTPFGKAAQEPTRPEAAIPGQKRPEAATPEAGAQKAKDWVNQNPTGDPDRDQAATGLADALAERRGIRVLYWGAKGDPAGQVTSVRPERRAEIESQRGAENKDRVLAEKEIFPYRVDVTSKGPQFVGWSPDNFEANIGKLAEWLGYVSRKGSDVTQQVPYEFDAQTGRFTAKGRAELLADAQRFMDNQRAGFTGAGGELVVPAEVTARGFTQPEQAGLGVVLDQNRADIINYLFNVQIPEKVSRVAPLHLAGQEVSEATLPGRLVEPVRPRGEYAPEKLEKAGIPGPRRVLEVNPFRQWVEQTAKDAGVARPSLIEVSQRLNINRIEKAVPSLRPEVFGGNVLTLAAGFQPSGNPRAIKSAAVRDRKTGKVYEGSWHGEALQKAISDIERIPLEEAGEKAFTGGILDNFEDGFTTNTPAEFLNRESGYQRAIEIKQIKPGDYAKESGGYFDNTLETDSFERTRQFQAGAEEARRVAGMTPAEFAKWGQDAVSRGGFTRVALDIGAAAPNREFVDFLKASQMKSKAEFKALADAGRLMDAVAVANRTQFFREAYEAATGTGSVGFAERQKDPNARFPFPESEAQAQPRKRGRDEEALYGYAKGVPEHWLDASGTAIPAPKGHASAAFDLLPAGWNSKGNETSFYESMFKRGYLRLVQDPGVLHVEGSLKSWLKLPLNQRKVLEDIAYETRSGLTYNTRPVDLDIQAKEAPRARPVADTRAARQKALDRGTPLNPEEAQAQPRPKLSEEPEAIKEAAVKSVTTGKIYTGTDHYHAFEKMRVAEELPAGTSSLGNTNRGFVTNEGEFLDIYEARKRAQEYGQISDSYLFPDRLESDTFARLQQAQAAPKTTYTEAAKDEGNPWIRPPGVTDNSKRLLMMQFSSDLINRESSAQYNLRFEDRKAKEYYDRLYAGAREGYARLQDFWEIPQWTGFLSKFAPNADLYVVRDMAQAKDFLRNANYGRVAFSALDVNAKLIKELAKDYQGTFDVGGYAAPSEFKGVKNIKWHDSMKSLAKDMGVPYVEGVDYRHFAGSDVIPRLTMSQGCKHKCAFCTAEKTLKETPKEVIEQQVDEIGRLGAKLVYLNDKTFGQAENYKTLPDIYERIKAINPEFKGFIIQTTASQMRNFSTEWLAKSGIKFVELGIETYNDPILKAMHKPATESLMDRAVAGLREAKIALIPNILIGLPGETAESYARTLDFLKRNKDIISHANIYNLAVYKEAELGKKLTTATEGDFDENVLEKSWMTNPEVHRTYAGDLYGFGNELLGTKPESAQMQPGREGGAQFEPAEKIDDLTELWTPKIVTATGRLRPVKGDEPELSIVPRERPEPIETPAPTVAAKVPEEPAKPTTLAGRFAPVPQSAQKEDEETPTAQAQPGDKFPKGEIGAAFKKAWILPNGKIQQLGGTWHSDWLDQNRDLVKKFGVTEVPKFEGTDTEAAREAALKKGFARVNYEVGNGRLVVEARAADWNKVRDAYERLITTNLDDIDSVRTTLMNRDLTEVVDSAEVQLFRIKKDADKIKAVPFLDEAPREAGTAVIAEPPSTTAIFRGQEEKARATRAENIAKGVPTLTQAQAGFASPEFAEELRKIRKGVAGGQTFNSDGSVWQSPKEPSDIVSLASVNLPQGELTAESFLKALGPYSELLEEPGVVAGVFAFSQEGKPTVSIDVNLVVPKKFRKNTLQFAKDNDQVSVWDAEKSEEVRTGGKGSTVLKSLGEISDAIPGLSQGKPVDVAEILRQNRESAPAEETGDLFGAKRVLSTAEIGNMTKADLARHFPEAVIPGRRDEAIPSDITKSPLFKLAENRAAAVKAFARKLVEFVREYQDSSEFKSGLRWYSEFVPLLKKVFGKDHRLMAELLAATSPQNAPESNYAYALDALEGFKSGRFDKMVAKFESGLEKINDGSWEKWFEKEVKAGAVPEPPATPTPAAFLEHWNNKHGLIPLQSNGKRYGISSPAVLQVLARRWLEKTGGLKTQNFVRNLLGEGHEATIDLWADRTMRRIGYAGFKERWRILPKNATGVSDVDFLFSQEAFKAAAEELGVKPDALQGGLWFAEKHLWSKEGWSRLDLGDFRKEIKKTELLRAGVRERTRKAKAEKTAGKAEQTGLSLLVEPRKLKE